ncbi:MAG: SDR family oxidoreductase [Pirellulales bacterium]
MIRVLVIGGSGMLGHKLCQLLPQHGFAVAATIRRPADFAARYPGVFRHVQILADVDALDDRQLQRAIDSASPHVVVNCAGIVKQLPAARDPLASVGVNAYLPHKLARLCGRQDRRLIHVSTDCVFAGTRGMYRECDPSDAHDLYGMTKYLGETVAEETAAVTLRTSIVGRELEVPGHGLLEWFLAQNGTPVRGFARATFSGLTTHELARVVAKIVIDHPRLQGLYQVASQPITKFDLLQLVRRAYGLPTEITRDEEVTCDRSLNMARLHDATGYVPPAWREMIAETAQDSTPYVDFHHNQRN